MTPVSKQTCLNCSSQDTGTPARPPFRACSNGNCVSGCLNSLDGASCCLTLWFPDENSNQSSVSDVYQLKVDSSTNSSPSPQQSESLSPAHTSDFRTDDSQPPTLGQEILEGECECVCVWGGAPYASLALASFCVCLLLAMCCSRSFHVLFYLM